MSKHHAGGSYAAVKYGRDPWELPATVDAFLVEIESGRQWFVQCDFCNSTRNTDGLTGTNWRISEKTREVCCGGCIGPWEAAGSWYDNRKPWRSIVHLLAQR